MSASEELRSGLPIWRCLAAQPLATRPLEGDTNCEVLVVGGGVSGALLAHTLVNEGVDTLLIDQEEPAQASTAASTGLLQYEVDTHLSDLIRKVGEQKAVHAYRRGLWAIDQIEALCRSWADDCGFSRRHTLYFASSRWHVPRLKREYECRRQYGFNVEYWDRGAVARRSSIGASGAIWSAGDGQLDPYRFTLQLLRQGQNRGLRIAGRTQATGMTPQAGGMLVETNRGRITARRVAVATGYQAHRYLPKQRVSVCSTYALATRPGVAIQGWPEGCLIWETARPYFYARETDDGRLLIGGADTPFCDDHQRYRLLTGQTDKLLRRFESLFPGTSIGPECVWGGTFAETKDGLALIGEHPDHPAMYFALGYGGNGITFSMIAARLIADLHLRRPNDDAQVFGFDR